MIVDLAAALARGTVALTLALVLVLLVRVPLRRAFGARAGYAAWAAVPFALAASAWPAASTPAVVFRSAAFDGAGRAMQQVAVAAPSSGATAAIGFWLAGAVAFMVVLLRRQRRFERALGRLTPRGRVHVAEHAIPGLPATLGLMRPRIVVPPGFKDVYGRRERALVLLHERAHVRAFDVPLRFVAAALASAFWFHPLAHLGARLFVRDQELACDARVLEAAPRRRRLYGETLLRIQCAADAVPLGCHWGLPHPLEERIAMLGRTPSPLRRRAGLALVVVLALAACGLSAAVAASTPAPTPQLHLVARVDGGAPRDWRGPLAMGTAHHYNWPTDDGRTWSMDLTVRPQTGGRFVLDAVVRENGSLKSRPRLVVDDGRAARIQIGEAAPSGPFRGLDVEITASGGPTR